MDGDMVIVKKPKWYKNWKAGKDLLRVSQSKDASMEHFGEYQHLIDKKLMLYSGIVSLPPNLFYLRKFLEILKQYPLKRPHNGCKNVSEQGVVAAAFGSCSCNFLILDSDKFFTPNLSMFSAKVYFIVFLELV
jgi:hypothetical protein